MTGAEIVAALVALSRQLSGETIRTEWTGTGRLAGWSIWTAYQPGAVASGHGPEALVAALRVHQVAP